MTLLTQILSFLFIFYLNSCVFGQKCDIQTIVGDSKLGVVEMDEKLPIGHNVTQFVVRHVETELADIDNVKLNFTNGEHDFLSISDPFWINKTHTSFDLRVKTVVDLAETDPDTFSDEILVRLTCEPNRADKNFILKINEVNDPPKFENLSRNFQFELSEKSQINEPFSKLSPPIYVIDVDFGVFGELEFSVWEDDTFKSKSTLIRADGEKVTRTKHLVNLRLIEMLNPKISKEHDLVLLVNDKSGFATRKSETAKIKIIVTTDPTIRLQPKCDNAMNSAIVGIKNKSIVGNGALTTLISAKIDDNSSVRYEIDEDISEFPTSFHVHEISGSAQLEIVDEKPLVDDDLTTTLVAIRAISTKNPILSDVCLLTLKLIRFPDFRNVTKKLIYVSRHSPPGTVIWTANAGPFVKYSFSGSISRYEIDSESGVLSTAEKLDNVGDETLVVIASKNVDGKDEEDEIEVTIRVVDNVKSLTQLKFKKKKYDEIIGVKNQKVVGSRFLTFNPSIEATNSVKYEIDRELSDCPDCFNIDPQTGKVEIVTVDSLIQKSVTKTTLMIKAISTKTPILSDVCLLTLKLIRFPDFRNVTKKLIYVSRHSPPGTVIWTANAGPFVKYSFSGSISRYEIDGESGVLSTAEKLDNVGDETLVVIASKNVDGKDEKDEIEVTIRVVDNVKSLTQLKFKKKKYDEIIGVKDQKVVGSKFLTFNPSIEATNSGVKYEIDRELSDCPDCFIIDPQTGKVEIVTVDSLIQKSVTKTTLIIKAISTIDELLSDSCSVSIQLVHYPDFGIKEKLSIYVPRDSKKDTVLWTAHAGPFMSYSLKDQNSYFDIKKESGIIVVKTGLNNAIKETITVMASKEINSKRETDEIEIDIYVVDRMDSEKYLKFDGKTVSGAVNVTDKSLVAPVSVHASVFDGSPVFYEFEENLSEFSDCFSIDRNGKLEIVNIDRLIDAKVTKTNLVVKAVSSDNPLYFRLNPLIMRLNYSPSFRNDIYEFYVPRGTRVGDTLWTANAGPFMSYRLKDPNTFFRIDDETGDLSVESGLDHATEEHITVIATKVFDGVTESDETHIVIFVVDSFRSATRLSFVDKKHTVFLNVENNTVVGDKILKLDAKTYDDSPVRYKIDKSLSDFSSNFAIDDSSAELRIIDLDPILTKKSIKTCLTIRSISVTNSFFSDISSVCVQLVYAPKFASKENTIYVPRNSSIDTILWTAQAGPFVKYSLKDQSIKHYEIDDESGAISIKTSLNSARDDAITIDASKEINGINETDSTKLEIFILDEVKTFATLKFEFGKYDAVVGIKNNKLDSDEILKLKPIQIQATISDGSEILYEIDRKLTKFFDCFSIDEKAEVRIIDVKPLVDEKLTQTTLLIRAFSEIYPTYDVTTVNVKLVYKPEFAVKTFSVFIPRKTTTKTHLWTANAGPFVSYSLKENSSFYTLNRDSGILSVDNSLENAKDETLDVIGTGEIGTDETQVKIHILDDEISHSDAQHSEIECSIEENKENAPCKGLNLNPSDFQIIKGNYDQNFRISNGQLLSRKSLDYEQNYSYFLILYSQASNTTLYVTVKVLDVNEPPYFETGKKIFAIAQWIQPNNLITTFKAKDPDLIGTKNSAISYSIGKSELFNLNENNGELKWMKKPKEKFYDCRVEASDDGSPKLSVSIEIKIYSLELENIFSLKVSSVKNLFLRTVSDIERDLSDVLQMRVVELLLKPDLESENNIEYQLFALNGDSVLPYSEVQKLLESKKEKLNEMLGKHSFEPSSLMSVGENNDKESKKNPEDENKHEANMLVIYGLSAIIGALVLAVIGFVICKTWRSASFAKTTSTKNLLKNEEKSTSDIKINIEKEIGEQENEETNLPEENHVSENKEIGEVQVRNKFEARIVSSEEVSFEELADPRFSVAHELPEEERISSGRSSELEYDLPEVDYKLGERKSVSFKMEEEHIPVNIIEGENGEIDEINVENAEIDEINVENEEIDEINVQNAEIGEINVQNAEIDEINVENEEIVEINHDNAQENEEFNQTEKIDDLDLKSQEIAEKSVEIQEQFHSEEKFDSVSVEQTIQPDISTDF